MTHEPTQSTGHRFVLQSCEDVAPFVVPHATPPLAAEVVTVNVRRVLPAPQDAEHEPHDPHKPTQSVPTSLRKYEYLLHEALPIERTRNKPATAAASTNHKR